MTPLQIFRLVATEFSSISDETVSTYITLYTPFVNQKIFGDLYPYALAYLTAHNMKMSGMEGGSEGLGSVADSLRIGSVSEGETSVSFSSSQSVNLQTDGQYALTQYGLKFLELKRSLIIPIHISGENVYGV